MMMERRKPGGPPREILAALLNQVAARISPEMADSLGVPSDELHREILLPLLPAFITDEAIRQHWGEPRAAGFFARLAAHFSSDAPVPRWTAEDFEIRVVASYHAGPDAKALADTLLSEEILRDFAADILNRFTRLVWEEISAGVEVGPADGSAESSAAHPAGLPLVEEVIEATPDDALVHATFPADATPGFSLEQALPVLPGNSAADWGVERRWQAAVWRVVNPLKARGFPPPMCE